jgi:hypothetical protein
MYKRAECCSLARSRSRSLALMLPVPPGMALLAQRLQRYCYTDFQYRLLLYRHSTSTYALMGTISLPLSLSLSLRPSLPPSLPLSLPPSLPLSLPPSLHMSTLCYSCKSTTPPELTVTLHSLLHALRLELEGGGKKAELATSFSLFFAPPFL